MEREYKVIERLKIHIDQLYMQYVPDRFKKGFYKEPSEENLKAINLPHIDLLNRYIESKNNDLTKTDYYKMHSGWGRDDKYISDRITRFINTFESISKNGMKVPLLVCNGAIHERLHNGYEIYNGHHRVAICIVLGVSKVDCEVIELISGDKREE